jgi:hypothetical protein
LSSDSNSINDLVRRIEQEVQRITAILAGRIYSEEDLK